MNKPDQFKYDVYDLMSLIDFKLNPREVELIIFNQSEINNYPQLTEQEKISLLGELDNN
jgi:hypothetical protein